LNFIEGTPIKKELTALGRRLLARDCELCAASGARQPVCDACTETLPILDGTCHVCALPVRQNSTCGQCLSHPPHFDRTLAVWAYEYPIDRLVQSFKFHHRLELAPWFATALAARALAANLCLQDLVIVPMPLHRSRLVERGFNQAMEIARQFATITHGTLMPSVVEKHRQTRLQSDLPLKERWKNIRGAYRCSGSFATANVAVVDDVMTTGASLNELARVLKLAGAKQVVNLVIARTLPLNEFPKPYRRQAP
jgi:ComF family protein